LSIVEGGKNVVKYRSRRRRGRWGRKRRRAAAAEEVPFKSPGN